MRPSGTQWVLLLAQAHRWCVLVSGLAVAFAVNLAAAPTQTPKPNIVFILADDLGYGDLSSQNPNSKIRTPRLDDLGSQGMSFSSAHAPSALCTPSRYSILCGQFCWRSRLKSGVLHGWDEPVLPQGKLTVAGMLRDQGYITGCFGKWHLGLSWPFLGTAPPGFDPTVQASDINWKRRISGGPVDHGFDYYFGINIANEAPYAYILNDRVVGTPNTQYNTTGGLERHWAGPGVPGWDWSQVLPTVVSNAMGWIDQSTGQGSRKPFFMYLSLPGPHQPVAPTAQFRGTSQAGPYGDYVQELDWAVGRILDKLQSSGVASNTLVIFTSDNGPDEFAYQRLQEYGHSSMGPLRGVKNDLWEGGHRVPFLARWPGRIAAGATNSQVICHVDLMRTFAELVGVHLPADAAEDSISFLPALLGGGSTSGRSSLILESGRGQFGLWTNDLMFIDSSTGDGHDPELEPLWFKQSRGYPGTNIFPALLYDLGHDLAECTNLYSPQLASPLRMALHNQRATQTWCGLSSGTWTNHGNWSQKTFPAGFDLVYSNTIFAGSLRQSLGTNLSINSLSLIGLPEPLSIQSGGPFSLNIANGIDMSLAAADLILDTPVLLAQSQIWTVTNNQTLALHGQVMLNGSELMLCGVGNFIFTNTLAGLGGLRIRGAGFVFLGGSNLYMGGTELSGGGFLVAADSHALGGGALEIPNNSTLQVEPGVGLTNAMAVSGFGGVFQNIQRGAITIYHPGTAEVRGPVFLENEAGFYAHQAASVLAFRGPIGGDANLSIMPGTGTVMFAANNVYAGTTLIQGKLELAGGLDRLPVTTRVLLGNCATASLKLNGTRQTVRSLSGGGPKGGDVLLANGTLTVNEDCSSSYGGSIRGEGALIKTNSGTLELAGNCSHTGTTTVSCGTLLVNGTLGGSGLFVGAGTLGGTGVITAPVTVQNGGMFSPGAGPGTFTISNSLTLSEQSTVSVEVDPARPAACRVQGLSHVTYGGALRVNLPPSTALAAGQSFQIFSAATSTGQFSAVGPSPAPGLAWNFNPLNGTLTIVAQPNLRGDLSDPHHLRVSWSGSGFHLQAQTNSLLPGATNWFDYPGGALSPLEIPIDPGRSALFLRLVSP